ncbi:MAG: glycosyltransferase [Candidatus Erginobacter occultus]|nr:glycosyltransferase [Candidatus Erginobacter occultus]
MLEDTDILFLSGIRWEFSFQRHQQIATLLARRNRVLFFEIGLSPANLIKEPAVTLRHWKRWLRGPEEIHPRLFRCTAPPVFPLNRSVIAVNRINQEITFRAARRAGKKLGMTPDLVWISDPYFSRFALRRGRALTVFDWIHDEGEIEGSRLDRVYRRLRGECLKGADLVFTPSRMIYDRQGQNDPRFHLVPHGVNLPPGPVPASPPPEDISSIPSPIIGFIGTIGPAVDLELLDFLARSKPDWSWVLIGETRTDPGKIPTRPNVYFLGPKKPEELSRYLSRFSAGIIPYRVNSLTETVHPVKTYQYLAAGLPVVSSRLPELAGLGDLVRREDDPAGFLRALEEILAADREEARQPRRDFARGNSWEKRVEEIGKIIAVARAAQSASGENVTRSVTS